MGLYSDEELRSSVRELFGYDKFVKGMKEFLPSELADHFIKVKESINNCYEFQTLIIHPFLNYLLQISTTDFHSSGLDYLASDEKYLFISNHRDIGLDSAFVNLQLYDHQFTTCQIAIGSNLMKHRVGELIFRINKSFVVERSGSPRELYQASVTLSNYIKDTIKDRVDSIWLAQREGRAKDGNDKTQVGLLKMLGLSSSDNYLSHFKALNVVPVALSYEYDPCDLLKTKEYINQKYDQTYQKTFDQDMASLLLGLKGQKGKVSVNFGQPLSVQINEIKNSIAPKKQLEQIAALIDLQIYNLYQLNPINYIAHDLLEEDHHYGREYSKNEFNHITKYFDKRVSTFASGHTSEAREYLLSMYANPVKNIKNKLFEVFSQ